MVANVLAPFLTRASHVTVFQINGNSTLVQQLVQVNKKGKLHITGLVV